MKLESYKANRSGMRALLGSDLVRLQVIAMAAPIAIAAQAAYDAHPPHQGEFVVQIDSQQGAAKGKDPRARVAVIARHPAALHYERHYRVLGGAVDAARG